MTSMASRVCVQRCSSIGKSAFSTDCARPPCTTGYHPQARQRVSGSAAVQAASRPPDGGGVALRAGLGRGERRQALRCGETYLREQAGAATLHFSGYEVAHKSDKRNPLVKAFLKAIREHGGEPKFKV